MAGNETFPSVEPPEIVVVLGNPDGSEAERLAYPPPNNFDVSR